MRYSLILNILGLISKYISVMFVIPIVAAILLKEYNDILPFVVALIVALVIGYLFSFNNKNQKEIDNIKNPCDCVFCLGFVCINLHSTLFIL